MSSILSNPGTFGRFVDIKPKSKPLDAAELEALKVQLMDLVYAPKAKGAVEMKGIADTTQGVKAK